MTQEQSGIFKFRGKDTTIVGTDLKAGQTAPEFIVQDQDFAEFKGLEKTQGKVRILLALPSLDTDVCDRETRRFNKEAASLSKDIAILAISNDLPYTQKRWCGATGVDQVKILSDHLSSDFGKKFGVLIKEVGVLRRAVFVIDRQGKITYAAYMPALGDEPTYDEVLTAAQAAL
jgi:thiol peroxidase